MRARSIARSTVAAWLALALAACLTPAAEQKEGDQEARKVSEEVGLVRDPALDGYLRAVGEKLAAVSERPEGPWQFAVADQPEPNAFALPGGYVYVTRGLLSLLNSEDELACVLGHEMAHVTARHSTKRMGAAIATAPLDIATGLAGLAVGIVSPTLGGVVAGGGKVLTAGLVLAPFSREQEHEADALGQTLAARAGYDPAALPRFLQTLDRDLALTTGEERERHFLDSHPLGTDRVARTEERGRQLARAAASPIAPGRGAFLARLEGIVVGDDPAGGVFEGSRFLHPQLDLALEFPAGWTTRNTNAAAGAISPSQDAVVALRSAAQDSSLGALLDKMSAQQRDLRFERFPVNGLPAARTQVSGRGHIVEITFIEYEQNVYAVIGESAESSAKQYASVFRKTAGSFRALSASERRSIRESRLRVRAARAAETPARIAERTGSTWNGDRVAVANEVAVGDRLTAGWAVKLALPQPYTARGR